MLLRYLVKFSVLQAILENKTTSVTTHFKKLTTVNNAFYCLSYYLNNCRILQCLRQMFNVSTSLLGDVLLKWVLFDEVKAYKTKCARFWATLYMSEDGWETTVEHVVQWFAMQLQVYLSAAAEWACKREKANSGAFYYGLILIFLRDRTMRRFKNSKSI